MDEFEGRREAAIKRLAAKRGFNIHVVVYVLVNVLLVLICLATGARNFWPIWPILGWGVGLVFHAWATYFQRPIGEADIRREMEKG